MTTPDWLIWFNTYIAPWMNIGLPVLNVWVSIIVFRRWRQVMRERRMLRDLVNAWFQITRLAWALRGWPSYMSFYYPDRDGKVEREIGLYVGRND